MGAALRRHRRAGREGGALRSSEIGDPIVVVAPPLELANGRSSHREASTTAPASTSRSRRCGGSRRANVAVVGAARRRSSVRTAREVAMHAAPAGRCDRASTSRTRPTCRATTAEPPAATTCSAAGPRSSAALPSTPRCSSCCSTAARRKASTTRWRRRLKTYTDADATFALARRRSRRGSSRSRSGTCTRRSRSSSSHDLEACVRLLVAFARRRSPSRRLATLGRFTRVTRSVIVSAVRTPFGKLGGGLAGVPRRPSSARSRSRAGARARRRSRTSEVEYVIMGQVLQAGAGPGARAPGGDRRRAAEGDAGGHDQQGLRLVDPRRPDRRPDDPRRRRTT